MKSLINYLKESYKQYRLNFVEVKYTVEPSEIILQAPETFQESDVQQYMDDMWLQQLPSFTDYARKFFGNNNDNISDAHFEYDTFEHTDIEPREYVEWDSKYDTKNTGEDVTLDYYRIKNLKYIITFDRFDILGADDENAGEQLSKIFKAAESNNVNKWPIEIKFSEDNLEYRK